jgi:excinuclease ABC subunit C
MLRKMGVNCALFGLVKDSKHRTRAIATGSGEISLSKSRSAFNLATAIQDEVHRYAITYQAKKHRKNAYQLELTKVKGVGDKKAAKLITTFKTKEALKAATTQDIAAAAGVNADTAAALKEIIDEM